MFGPDDRMDEAPPAEEGSGLRRSPYLALGVAGVVVSTAFATVAMLAGEQADEAQPERTSNDTVQVRDSETSTSETTTSTTTPTTIHHDVEHHVVHHDDDQAEDEDADHDDGRPDAADTADADPHAADDHHHYDDHYDDHYDHHAARPARRQQLRWLVDLAVVTPAQRCLSR